MSRCGQTSVGSIRPKFEHQLPPKPGSVLILLYEDEGKIKFPLTKRPEYLGAHAGQISLPGGKAEPGENYIQTALREGEEEIGVHSNELKVIGRLSDFFVIPSNFLIVPVVAYSLTKPKFVPQESEVVKYWKATSMISFAMMPFRPKKFSLQKCIRCWHLIFN